MFFIPMPRSVLLETNNKMCSLLTTRDAIPASAIKVTSQWQNAKPFVKIIFKQI